MVPRSCDLNSCDYILCSYHKPKAKQFGLFECISYLNFSYRSIIKIFLILTHTEFFLFLKIFRL